LSTGIENFLGKSKKYQECQDSVTATNTFLQYKKIIYEEFNVITEHCPLPCKDASYSITLDYYSSNMYLNLKKEMSDDFLNKGVTLVMYYSSFTIEEHVETLVYDAENFLAAIGGNLGLFLGFSCLSLFLGMIRLCGKLRFKQLQNTSSQ